MNLVAFGLILICCHSWAIEIDDNFLARGTYRGRTKLENFLEGFKSTIRNGDSSLGIPPLDPLTMIKLPINISESQIRIDALLTNLREEGLSSYNVNSANFKVFGLKAHADISWPLVVASTNYSISKCNIRGSEIYGHGDMHAAAHDFRFQINVKFGLKKKHIQIKTLSTTISLRALDFNGTGFFEDDEKSKAWSKKISETVPKFINENQKEIVNKVNQMIMKNANEMLSKITFKDIKKMLG